MRTRLLAALSGLFLATGAFAADFVAPRLTGPIVDEVGVIARDDYAALDGELRALSASGKGQVAVLVAKSLQDLTIEEFGIRLAEAWKIGMKSGDARDRGAIFIIAPNDRKMRIEVGYGLEGDLPDAIASRILEEIVKPRIRANRMSDGIVAGVRAVAAIVRGEAASEGSADDSVRAERRPARGIPADLLFLGIFLLFFGIRNLFASAVLGGAIGFALFHGIVFGAVGVGVGLLLHFFLYRALGFGRRTRRGPIFWGGGGWGGGGFGGGGFGGGGGFSGGGGSFGGGGSSSSW